MTEVALFVLTCCAVPLTACLCWESYTRRALDAYWLEREKLKGGDPWSHRSSART